MGNNFRKIRDGGELRQQRVQQRQAVLPETSLRRVNQNLVEKQVDLRTQARDHRLEGLAGDTTVLFVEILFGPGFEQVRVERRQARRLVPLGLIENIADAFEAGRKRLEIGCEAQALDAYQALLQVHQIAPDGRHRRVHLVVL